MVESPLSLPIYKIAPLSTVEYAFGYLPSWSSPATSDSKLVFDVGARCKCNSGSVFISLDDSASGPRPHGEFAGKEFLRRLDVPLGMDYSFPNSLLIVEVRFHLDFTYMVQHFLRT